MQYNNIKVKTSRTIQAEQSRQRIYGIAFELIAQKGFDETSVTDICKAADCSVGAFYHHFPSKDSILEETFRIADKDFDKWLEFSNEGKKGRELILDYMNSYAELVSNTGLDFTKRFFTNKNKIFIRPGRPMQVQLTEIIRNAVVSGEIRITTAPEEACEWLFVCARGIVFHWCLHEGDFNLIEKMGIAMKRALTGIEEN